MRGPGSFPALLGKYRLIASLGSGGMAQVFLAVSSGVSGVNKLMVLKVMHRELAQEENFRRMFLDEARLAARLNHPNVVQTYEFGEEDGVSFIAMEYVEGQPLSKLIRKTVAHPLSLVARVRVLCDLLGGLHHAHELTDFDGAPLDVVHRDVSSPNVMVTYSGVVKLMDFGIAAATTASTVTETGTFKGKVSNAAPEQILCKKVDRRADVFAVGVLLWEALAERRISEGKNDAQLIHMRTSGLDPSIDVVAPDAPAALRAACQRAMALEPDDRFATAREMQQALSAWLAQQPPVDLGEAVMASFLEEQQQLKVLIEDAVKRSREDLAVLSSSSLALLRVGSPEAPPTPTSGPGRSDAGSSDPGSRDTRPSRSVSSASVPIPVEPDAAPTAPAPTRRVPLLLVSAAVVLTAIVLIARGTRSPATEVGAPSGTQPGASSSPSVEPVRGPVTASARAAASPEAAAPSAQASGAEAGRGPSAPAGPTRASTPSTRVTPADATSGGERGRPGRKTPTRSIDTDLPY